MKQANCLGKAPNKRQDPDAFDPWFPERGQPTNPGKIECFTCPVRIQCLEYQEYTDSRDGMWGGQIKKRDDRGRNHRR